jgi:hypothetical protein
MIFLILNESILSKVGKQLAEKRINSPPYNIVKLISCSCIHKMQECGDVDTKPQTDLDCLIQTSSVLVIVLNLSLEFLKFLY